MGWLCAQGRAKRVGGQHIALPLCRVPFIAYIFGALLFLRFSFNEAEHAEVIAELERQGRR